MKKWGVLVAVAALAVVAASGPAHSAMGVGVIWDGNGGVTPNMVLPIKMESGLIIEPIVGISSVQEAYYSELLAADEDAKPRTTQLRFGARIEKAMTETAATPLFGAEFIARMNSFSNQKVGGEDLDSRLDFAFGVYVGGSAKLAEGVDIVGTWGPVVEMIAKQKAGDAELSGSQTNFGSRASFSVRFWLWGIK